MSTKLKLLSTFLLLAIGQFFYAQVTGTVVDADDLPISDVLVTVQGSDASATTDLDGNFEIDAKVGDVLSFDNLGNLITKEVTSLKMGSVLLSNEIETLVITGYQTISEPKSTIAQTTISSDELENMPSPSVMQTLQGKVPGLNIMSSSGQPGAGSDVYLRGVTSLSGKNSPLYVVDGIQFSSDEFAKFYNQNDIETATVLKDAPGVSQYGNKGSAGVIVITTKRGKFNKPLAATVNANYGVNYVQPNDYNLMNAKDLLNFHKAYGSGPGASLTQQEIDEYKTDTNWEKYFLKPDVIQSYDVGLTSGSDKLTSYSSIGYLGQDGIVKKGSDLKRFTFRNNLDGKSNNGKFRYGTTSLLSYAKRNVTGSVGTGGVNQNALLAAFQSSPIVSPDEYKGSQQLIDLYNSNGTLLYTPLFIIDKLNTFTNKREEVRLSVVGEVNYDIFKDLTAGARLGGDYIDYQSLVSTNPVSFNGIIFSGGNPENVGNQSENSIRDFIMNNNISLKYNKVLNDIHTFNVGAFYEYSYYDRKTFGYFQNGIDKNFYYVGSDSGFQPDRPDNDLYVPTVNSSYRRVRLQSYFANFNYDYSNKYGLSASFRRDGSSRFRTGLKWGNFWSVGGRWNIDQEDFMADTKFSLLKLRASYGTAGNQIINGTTDFSAIGLYQTSVSNGSGYQGNPRNNYAIRDETVSWETVSTLNFGLDLDYAERFRMTFDWYNKITDDLFRTVPVSFGVSPTNAVIVGNFGKMRNTGVELLLEYDLIKNSAKDMFLTIRGNGSYNKNEVLDVPTADGISRNGTEYLKEGDIVESYYLVPYLGVNPANGELLFRKNDGTQTEDLDLDRDGVYTNKSFRPVYQGSFGFNFGFKNFYVDTQFNYAGKLYRIDGDYAGFLNPAQSGDFNVSRDLLNYWTEDNRNTNIPKLRAAQLSASAGSSDRFLVDASYVRLRDVRVGYLLNGSEWFPNSMIRSVNIYLQGQNLKTWSKWKGWEPESNRPSEDVQYPSPRSLQMGVQINF